MKKWNNIMLKKSARFISICLIIFGITFSNVPFNVVSKIIDSYIEARTIVDLTWKAQKDSNVVDKFVSLRSLPEKLKIHEARAATTFINVAHYNSSGSASATVNKPTNTANGDIMFALIMRSNTGAVNSVPAGWALIGDHSYSTTYRQLLYWKLAAGEGASYVWGFASSGKTAITIATYRGGFDTASPIDVVSNTAYVISNTTVRAATMNVSAPNSILLNFATFYSTTVRAFTKPSIPTTDWVENYDGGATTSDFSRTIDSMTWTGSGATGNIDTINAASGSTGKHAFAVALKPPSANSPPIISITQPPAGNTVLAEGSSYNVTYSLSDSDSVVTAAFYYDTNNAGLDGNAIAGACTTAAEGTNATCAFNTSVLTPGIPYYIYGITNDGTGNVSAYSAGTITINDAPALSISEPNGTGDTVSVGSSYNITYSLADSDNVVTSAFYYDTNNDGVGGTAITGACAAAAEGTNATCAWNTTGVSLGSYYVYGVANDGVNPAVTGISTGTITIQSAGSLTVDVVDSGGIPVASPSFSFSAKTFDWTAQSSTATLGTASQKIRVTNTTATPGWTLSIAATAGPTTLWTSGSDTYDFNGSSANGRLQVNASSSTITPQGGCATTGISKGASTYFVQGTQDSGTLLSASASAQTGCYWDLTSVGMTQDIPASQVTGSYTLNMTLTAA